LVSECAVVGLPDRHWGEVVVLVVVPRSAGEIEESEIRAVLQHRLARFKHPKRIVQRPNLPKTALGKVQKELLRDQLLLEL
jgi:acyl-CoA synthetase (AMP-forming)/AMP-acid ligase II